MRHFAKFGTGIILAIAMFSCATLTAKDVAPVKPQENPAAVSPAVVALHLKSACCFMMNGATGTWGDMEGRALEFQSGSIRYFDSLKERGAPAFTKPLKGFISLSPAQVTAPWFQKTFAELLGIPGKSAEVLAQFNAARKNMVGQAYFSTRPGMPPYGPDLDLFINTSTGDLYLFSSVSYGRLKNMPPGKTAPAKK